MYAIRSYYEYQQAFEEDLPPRTANYDLNDLMHQGIVTREGAGSSTHYRLAPTANIKMLQELIKGSPPR